ncbi:MAG TPA: glycoside hydrolase, partial [Treponemataceae bacterium]|nr:glycoside hydrolase [Treponemataceae bacterium]
GVPWFEYQETVRVKVFYEDTASIVQRSMMYRVAGVRSVSFWRLGQEDPLIWKELSVKVPRLASQQTEN